MFRSKSKLRQITTARALGPPRNELKQKAAMFGLDARIALAIFGALSVITGATLYKTMDRIKATTISNDIVEMAKAVEQFYLDTGSTPSAYVENPNTTFNIVELIKDTSINNWKGPYINNYLESGQTHFILGNTSPDLGGTG